jgi:hypothetical protein
LFEERSCELRNNILVEGFTYAMNEPGLALTAQKKSTTGAASLLAAALAIASKPFSDSGVLPRRFPEEIVFAGLAAKS